MCLRINLYMPPMSQDEIDSKRRALKIGYALYAGLIAVFVVGGLVGQPHAAGPILGAAGIAGLIVAISARNNLKALGPVQEEGLFREIIASSMPEAFVQFYLRDLERMGRPMVVAEAQALKKQVGRPMLAAAALKS